MGNGMDQVQEARDANDQSSIEQQESLQIDLQLSQADNQAIIEFYRQSANNDSTKLYDLSQGTDNPSSSHSLEKCISELDKRVDDLRDGKSERLSDLEVAMQKGNVRDANGKPLDKETQRQATKLIEQRTATRLENELILSAASSNSIKGSIDRLINVAGSDLPEDFEGRVADFLNDQFRQREGNRLAEENGWTDVDQRRFVAPCAQDDDESTADEKLAAVFDRFADAYKARENGELTDNAAVGYAGDNDDGDLWKSDWRYCMLGVLTPTEEDDQKSIGSCAMNTQIIPACKRRPDLVADELCSFMTQGYWDSPFGTRATVYADELGRGDPQNNNGQTAFVFLFNAGLSSASYGDSGNGINGMHHMNGNNTTVMSEGARSLFGAGVEDGEGSWDRFSPGHSMVALNEFGVDGVGRVVQRNHWSRGQGSGELGDGEDHRYGYTIDVDAIDEQVAKIITA